ncbi:hypothetical protein V6N13_024216 [Hibiscus sabdariffa]
MAASPSSVAYAGEDTPGWRWDAKRESHLGSTYDYLMDRISRSKSVKWARNVVADKLADLGKQQSWECITYVIPPIGFEELVADEQRIWMEQAAGTVTSFQCRRVDPGG